jgi:hypothetical protein
VQSGTNCTFLMEERLGRSRDGSGTGEVTAGELRDRQVLRSNFVGQAALIIKHLRRTKRDHS